MYFGVQCWDKRAQVCSDALTKGSWVLVQGELFKNGWTAEDGTEKSNYKIDAREIDFGPKESPAPQQGAQKETAQAESLVPPAAINEEQYVDEDDLVGAPF